MLGTWHMFKQLSLELFKLASSTYLCHMHFFLKPGSTFLLRPRLTHITHTFSLLRLSYPMWADTLSLILANTNASSQVQINARNLLFLIEFAIPVCHDFGLYIQLNDGKKVLEFLYHVLRLFLITKCNSYVYPLVLFLLLLKWYKNSSSPAYDIFMNQCNMFNEEDCETSLAYLSRRLSKSSEKYNCQTVSDMYRQLQHDQNVCRKLENNLDIGRKVNEPHRIKSEWIKKTGKYMNNILLNQLQNKKLLNVRLNYTHDRSINYDRYLKLQDAKLKSEIWDVDFSQEELSETFHHTVNLLNDGKWTTNTNTKREKMKVITNTLKRKLDQIEDNETEPFTAVQEIDILADLLPQEVQE